PRRGLRRRVRPSPAQALRQGLTDSSKAGPSGGPAFLLPAAGASGYALPALAHDADCVCLRPAGHAAEPGGAGRAGGTPALPAVVRVRALPGDAQRIRYPLLD